MEMVYLVNGAESGGGSGGGGGGSPGYPMVKAVVTENAPAPEASGCPSDEVASPEGRKGPRAVGLQDRSVTRVELKTGDAVRINLNKAVEVYQCQSNPVISGV